MKAKQDCLLASALEPFSRPLVWRLGQPVVVHNTHDIQSTVQSIFLTEIMSPFAGFVLNIRSEVSELTVPDFPIGEVLAQD